MIGTDGTASHGSRGGCLTARPPVGAPPGVDAALDSAERELKFAERDRDAAEASRDRFSFLAEASRCLADSLDYESTLTTVAGMSLPYLDAWCIVDVLAEGGEVRRITVVHPDPDKQEAARVRQILVNLLSNAIKFTPAGGHVRLECRTAGDGDGGDGADGEGSTAPSLLFVVSDSGEGVRAEDAERIFEPFIQGAAGLTRPHGGTGLGLPISRRLARLMGGDVTMDGPSEGLGATFTLRLPAAAAVVSAEGAEGDAAMPVAAERADGRASAGRGLATAGELLRRQLAPTVDEFVRRARADEALGVTDEMTDVDVADHLGTLVVDVANSLRVLASASGDASELLADGSRIQRVIGELHGAPRQRIGWSEANLVREAGLVREVFLAALRQALAGDARAAAAAATFALERLLDERNRAVLSGFRASAGGAG